MAGTLKTDPETGAAHSVDRSTRIGRLGLAFFLSQVGFSITTTAGGAWTQQLATIVGGDDKILIYSISGTVGALVAAAAAILFGELSDKLKRVHGTRVPLILGASVAAALSFAGLSFAQDAVGIIVGWALFQLFLNASIGSITALMPEYVMSKVLGRVSAASGLGVLLGQAFGGVVGGALLDQARFGFLVLPWVFPIGALLLVVLLRRVPKLTVSLETSVAETIATSAIGAPRFRWMVGDSTFWWVFIGRALFVLGLYMATGYIVFIGTDYLGLDTAETGQLAGLATVLFALCAAVFIVITGPLSDRLGRRKPFVAGASVLLAVAAVPMVVAPSEVALYLFMALGGAAFGSYIAVDQALMIDALPPTGSNARDLGILNAATTLPGVIAPAFAGVIVSVAGYSALFIGVAIVAVLGAFAMLGVRRLR
jgi:MFS family permease